MDVRPQRIVELSEYGATGQITLEPLDFVRRRQLENNIGRTTHVAPQGDGLEMKSQDLGDLSVYRVMAYIVSAPFKFQSLEGFYNFMERLDKMKLGQAEALFKRLKDEINELKKEATSPLDGSQDTAQSKTEPNSSQMQ